VREGVASGRWLSWSALLILSSGCLSGCFTVDATLDPDGAGTIELTYPLLPNAKVEKEKERFSSPHVTLVSYVAKADHTAVVSVKFDDVTKLSTAEGFKQVGVTRSRDGDTERLRILVINPNVNPVAKDEGKDGPRITLRLPGKVLEANRKAEVAGDRVTWRMPLVEYLRTSALELTVSWAAAAPSGATSTTEPPAKGSGAGP